MISAEFFISGPANSPKGSLYGHPTVVTSPPHELLGQFLTGELDSLRCPLLMALARILAEIASGQRRDYEGGGEGHLLTISGNLVTIDTIYTDPPEMVQVMLEDFCDIFARWRAFISEHEPS
ncbi:unnamed protein product [Tuwongella immobilis]|uniref:Uncharacterized protein n=1 Tax=Tuwongella immobilis TaxID=692036 RepID=A0A6C2YLU0_9BACT|nr:unnamed protein product [Tuwongella immobilis]VTS00365.1 unnamed protein product [Tuwongella immobilis]